MLLKWTFCTLQPKAGRPQLQSIRIAKCFRFISTYFWNTLQIQTHKPLVTRDWERFGCAVNAVNSTELNTHNESRKNMQTVPINTENIAAIQQWLSFFFMFTEWKCSSNIYSQFGENCRCSMIAERYRKFVVVVVATGQKKDEHRTTEKKK